MTKRKTLQEFIDQSNKIHNYKFNYEFSIYVDSKTELIIICDKGHKFFQMPKKHLMGHGCQICGGSNRSSSVDFLKKSIKIHGNIYDHSKVVYINAHTPVILKCDNIEHTEFKIKPNRHLNGSGCPDCSQRRNHTQDSFIRKASKIHKNKFIYDKTIFITVMKKIKIKCPKHGYFNQIANDHLRGCGCPKCGRNISKLEIKWLNELNIKPKYRQISLPHLSSRIKVDGYDPKTNTVYEFLGSYWHGDPELIKIKKFKQKTLDRLNKFYTRTINRENKIRKAGYNYQFIWELDYKSKLLTS